MDVIFIETFAPFLLMFFLIVIAFPLIALISALKNEFPNNDKIAWILVILFLPVLGAILYFIIGRPKKLKK